MSLEYRETGKTDDYLRIILTDEEDIQDVVAKLRTVYPNLLRLTYDNTRTRDYRSVDSVSVEEMDVLRAEDIFAELYELQNNVAPDEKIMEIVKTIIDDIRGEEGI